MIKPSLMLKKPLMKEVRDIKGEQLSIQILQRALRELWEQIESLQEAIIMHANEITLKTGDASIVLKRDGTITITGKDITIKGSGKVSLKADKDIVLKGSKIVEN